MRALLVSMNYKPINYQNMKELFVGFLQEGIHTGISKRDEIYDFILGFHQEFFCTLPLHFLQNSFWNFTRISYKKSSLSTFWKIFMGSFWKFSGVFFSGIFQKLLLKSSGFSCGISSKVQLENKEFFLGILHRSPFWYSSRISF